MSFIQEKTAGRVYATGYFLEDPEKARPVTVQVSASDNRAIEENGGKFLKAGTVYPANTTDAIGFIFQDVDVTTGDMPGPVVLEGTIYTDRLPETITGGVQTALEAKGFKFKTAPAVTRPY